MSYMRRKENKQECKPKEKLDLFLLQYTTVCCDIQMQPIYVLLYILETEKVKHPSFEREVIQHNVKSARPLTEQSNLNNPLGPLRGKKVKKIRFIGDTQCGVVVRVTN